MSDNVNSNNDVDSAALLFQKRLNVDAPVFIPGGVSSGGGGFSLAPSVTPNSSDVPVTHTETTVLNKDNELNKKKSNESNDDVCDDWEANADEEENDDVEEECEEEEASVEQTVGGVSNEMKQAKKPKKRRVKKVSECRDDLNKKEHLNIVFIGHVDAGKSTIGGQILYLTGMVDKRTLEKYEREAKEKNRESWYLSWALDTNQEEREKGKTVEVGRAFFETDHKQLTLLDAPGHRGYVSNMIGGASQADLAVLVISARKGEFETGFERGGQTREHAMLAKTAGVKHLIVLINKMDDTTVEWNQDRFIECKEKLLPYLKKCGFNPKTEVYFLPCSGLTGEFLKDAPPESVCPWYRGPTFIDYIDALPSFSRQNDGPFRMPVIDKYKDMGTVVLGKVESGYAKKGSQLILMPNKKIVEVLQLWSDEDEVTQVMSGENVKIKLKGIEEEEVSSGFALCDANSPCNVGRVFDAQVVILEHKSIICPGYSCVLHIHAAIEEVTVKNIICLIDKKTGEKLKNRVRFVKQDQVAIMRLECAAGLICMETFKQFPQMGRFTLRDEGRTIAIGKVLRVVE